MLCGSFGLSGVAVEMKIEKEQKRSFVTRVPRPGAECTLLDAMEGNLFLQQTGRDMDVKGSHFVTLLRVLILLVLVSK